MTKTLITDGFEEETPPNAPSFVHNIVFGSTGRSDYLSDETIAVLVESGIIVLDRTEVSVGYQTNLYRSVEGVVPVRAS